MLIYDVSVPIAIDTPTYPGDPGIEITQWLSLAKGDPANVSLLHFGAHSATHVDAPAHFIEGGTRADSLPMDILIGEAEVVEVPDEKRSLDNSVVARIASGTRRVLFKTRNSDFWNDHSPHFRSDYTYIEPGGARALVKRGLGLVGIDYLSVERFKPETFDTHHILLAGGVVIIEGLNLSDVPPGNYELICLPLKIASGSGDGAPARVILRASKRESN